MKSIKIKTNDLYFLFFIILFSLFLVISKADLVGFLSLVFLALITFLFSKYYKSLTTILYVALSVRLVSIYFGNFILILPDSWGDATLYELYAWELSQKGFYSIFDHFPFDNTSYFIGWILAFFYSLIDRSIIMGQSISLFFGMCSVILGTLIANKIWGEKISIRVGWIIALYPTLVLYSSLILREAYIWFFFLVAIYGIVSWLKDKKFKSLIITLIGFIGATLYHGGMIIGAIIFLTIIILISLKEFLKKLSNLKISISAILLLIFSVISFNQIASISKSIPKIRSLNTLFNAEVAITEISQRNVKRAAFPEWTVPKTEFELLYKSPIRIIYFMFSPFPWDVKKPSHLFGLFDGLFHFLLIYFLIKNFRKIWDNKTLRMILFILVAYYVLFGMSTGNFGTGLRHRTKFIIVLILMVAPWIPNITLGKAKKT
jgi:hypothetical protein